MHHLGSSTRRRGAESPPTAVCAFVLLTTVTLLISYRYTCDHRAFYNQCPLYKWRAQREANNPGP